MIDCPVFASPQSNALCEAGRIPADEEAWLYHKLKTEVDPDSLPQETLPPGPVEDGVDTYAALGLAGWVSELSTEQKRGYVCGFPHFA